MHSTVDCADALICVGAGFGGGGAEGAGNDGEGTDGTGVGISAALAFRVGPVGAKAQRKIIDIKSGDFILQVSLIRRPSKLTREIWLCGAQELAFGQGD